eukprot:TRINITY_DN890_c0_g1_i1.p1 TRINITY_DN890_c0_g1~~TRINITY_DN890_c0_g1_i1.p1  ORF type:complete len:404 (-),score=61.46 TRINITY_DN890_c0_g1_i1:261-1472(-)
MPRCGAGIEFSNSRVSVDEILEPIGIARVLLVDSQQKHGITLPIPVTLRCGGDRVVLDGDSGDRLEAFLTPSSVIQRRFATLHRSAGSWGVDLAATGGMTWSFRVELESEDEAACVEASLRDAQQRVVGSLHTAIVRLARAAPNDMWYPSLEPLPPSQMESSNGRFILGGYVVLSHCKRMNHPVMLHESAEPQSARFRLMWGELRVSATHLDVDVKCFFYQSHERVSKKELVCVTTLSPDDEDMEIQGNVLILRGAEPRDGVRDATEVPGDEYLCFRCDSEARLWNEVARKCFDEGAGALNVEQHQRFAQATLNASFAEIAARQGSPTFPKEPMLARALDRALREREAKTQPTDWTARAMQEVDAETEEIARICRRQRDLPATESFASADFNDASGTVILARP